MNCRDNYIKGLLLLILSLGLCSFALADEEEEDPPCGNNDDPCAEYADDQEAYECCLEGHQPKARRRLLSG